MAVCTREGTEADAILASKPPQPPWYVRSPRLPVEINSWRRENLYSPSGE